MTPIDPELLEKARAAARTLAEADRQAQLARAEYHTSIRRMHLGGGSLREIAQALDLSHQRVQQIVQDAGGSWWSHVWRSRNAQREAICSVCKRPPSELGKLLAGPNVYICDECVAEAEAVAAGRSRRGAGHGFAPLERKSRARCSFCGKAAAPRVACPALTVCTACLATCREIVDRTQP